jgi:hypothetical protein
MSYVTGWGGEGVYTRLTCGQITHEKKAPGPCGMLFNYRISLFLCILGFFPWVSFFLLFE